MRSPNRHWLMEVDAERRTGVCLECGPVSLKKIGTGWRCRVAWRQNQNKGKRKARPHRRHVDATCARCGFVPEDLCQLDVHHLDGDHRNNAVENLRTLCANCHRLEHSALRLAS